MNKKWHQWLWNYFRWSLTPLYIFSQPRLFKEFDILQEIKVSLSQLFKSSSFCDANLYWSQYPKLWTLQKGNFTICIMFHHVNKLTSTSLSILTLLPIPLHSHFPPTSHFPFPPPSPTSPSPLSHFPYCTRSRLRNS